MVRKAYLARNIERLGVWLWNNHLWKVEIGLLPKEYSKNVHGPYVPYRYYGKKDTPFGQVKLGELSAWLARRRKTPYAMSQAIGRSKHIYSYHSWVNKYLGARHHSMAIYWQFTFMVAALFWFLTWNRYWLEREYRYHW